MNKWDFLCNIDLRTEIIKKLKNDGKPIVIYGAGKFGIAQANCMIENKIRVLCL